MAHDDGGGKLFGEALQKGAHTVALRLGARVAGVAGSIETALIADADGVLVVVLAVGADLPQGATFVHLAVACDVVMVADVLPTSLEVVFFPQWVSVFQHETVISLWRSARACS